MFSQKTAAPSLRTFKTALAALGLAMCLGSGSASAGDLSVEGAWVRFAPPSVKAHAAYMLLTNKGASDRYLVAAESPDYGRVELHISRVADGVATMERLEQIDIAAGKTVEFKPRGLHLMLIGPKGKQEKGAQVPITLVFMNGERLPMTAVVKDGKGKAMDHSGHGHHGTGDKSM